jgi:hypothetical protein
MRCVCLPAGLRAATRALEPQDELLVPAAPASEVAEFLHLLLCVCRASGRYLAAGRNLTQPPRLPLHK